MHVPMSTTTQFASMRCVVSLAAPQIHASVLAETLVPLCMNDAFLGMRCAQQLHTTPQRAVCAGSTMEELHTIVTSAAECGIIIDTHTLGHYPHGKEISNTLAQLGNVSLSQLHHLQTTPASRGVTHHFRYAPIHTSTIDHDEHDS
jgi:hypothetical protein